MWNTHNTYLFWRYVFLKNKCYTCYYKLHFSLMIIGYVTRCVMCGVRCVMCTHSISAIWTEQVKSLSFGEVKFPLVTQDCKNTFYMAQYLSAHVLGFDGWTKICATVLSLFHFHIISFAISRIPNSALNSNP